MHFLYADAFVLHSAELYFELFGAFVGGYSSLQRPLIVLATKALSLRLLHY